MTKQLPQTTGNAEKSTCIQLSLPAGLLNNFFQWHTAHQVAQQLDSCFMIALASPDFCNLTPHERVSLLNCIKRVSSLVQDIENHLSQPGKSNGLH
jgi:hypothetical protein